MQATAAAPTTARREQVFAPWLIIALAALAVPRVVAHDLRLVAPGSIANALLAIVPGLIWLAVILWRRPARPFLTGLLIGISYGIFLAVAHQLLWNASFGANPPRIGSTLDPLVEGLVLRAAAFISSILTGVVTGLLIGAIAAGLAWAQRRFAPS